MKPATMPARKLIQQHMNIANETLGFASGLYTLQDHKRRYVLQQPAAGTALVCSVSIMCF